MRKSSAARVGPPPFTGRVDVSGAAAVESPVQSSPDMNFLVERRFIRRMRKRTTAPVECRQRVPGSFCPAPAPFVVSGTCIMTGEFGDVLLRHLLQSGSRVASFLSRFQCDRCFPRMRKPSGQKWRTSYTVPTSIAWRQALIDTLYNAGDFRVLSVDGTMKIAMGLRRYETMISRREDGVVDNVVDDNTCVLTIRTLEGGL